jgi:hypothetical protein
MNRDPWPSSVFSPEVRAELARKAGRAAAGIEEIKYHGMWNKGGEVMY